LLKTTTPDSSEETVELTALPGWLVSPLLPGAEPPFEPGFLGLLAPWTANTVAITKSPTAIFASAAFIPLLLPPRCNKLCCLPGLDPARHQDRYHHAPRGSKVPCPVQKNPVNSCATASIKHQ
jgi:hypothetical protein